MRIGLGILKPETVQCLAFDAVTAWRVFSLDRYARDEPESPAAELLPGAEREVIGSVVRASGCCRRPFPPDIRSWAVLLARIACQ